ncbi:MAG: hypothetical protein AAF411_23810 [Myxococcota bacterium]
MELAAYEASLKAEFARLRFIDKRDDRFSKLIDGALRIVTLGGQSRYMTHYVTTIGQTIYLPTSWAERPETERLITLRHEAVHLHQFRRFGIVLMSVLYLLPFFPLGLAYGRARLEWEAYAETLRATRELRGLAAASALRPHITRQFTGPAYGWMWPFEGQVHRWIDDVLAEAP